MAQELEKPLVDITRRPANLPLLVSAGTLLVFVLIGVAASIGSGSYLMLLLFTVVLIAFAAFTFFSVMRSSNSTDSSKVLNWRTAVPEVQQQSLAIEVSEIARTFGVDPSQTGDLYSAYIVAEDLALRQIQEEQNAPLLRHIQAGRSAFDALIIKPGVITCVEVSFLVTPVLRQEKIDAVLKKTALLRRFLKAEGIESRIALMFVVVTQLTPQDEAHLRTTLGKHRFIDDEAEMDDWQVDYDDIDIQLLDFEELQRRYLSEV